MRLPPSDPLVTPSSSVTPGGDTGGRPSQGRGPHDPSLGTGVKVDAGSNVPSGPGAFEVS